MLAGPVVFLLELERPIKDLETKIDKVLKAAQLQLKATEKQL
jgi:hypothetical protein